MMAIAEEMIQESPENYDALRRGMLKALNLRAMFWNNMRMQARRL